jgi:hypothetical protein
MANQEPTKHIEALKRISVISDRQDKYSISLSKYIALDDYVKSKRDVTNYEIIEKQNDNFEILIYRHNRVVEKLKNCVCIANVFQIPRQSAPKQGCYLYNIYVRFHLFR